MGEVWLSGHGRAIASAVAAVVTASEASRPGLWTSGRVRESMVPNAVVQELVTSTALAQASLDAGAVGVSPAADTLAMLLVDACHERGVPVEVLSCVREAWLRPDVVGAAVALHRRDDVAAQRRVISPRGESGPAVRSSGPTV